MYISLGGILIVATWLRNWLRRRLFPSKLPFYYIDEDGEVFLSPGHLTFLDHSVVLVLHLAIIAAGIAAIILGFLGVVRLVYG